MTAQEIRLECLRLSIPRDIANPDVNLILERAKAFEAFVIGEGQAKSAPSERQTLSLPQKTGQPASQQTRHSK